MNPIPAPNPGEVRIRMYRQGLGDCFLLTFRAHDDTPRYVMIDCGILQQSPSERDRMRQVLESIHRATGGRVHVLVATHEHWDHVCGFHHGQDLYSDLNVDEVWLAWTEDPDDEQAKELQETYERSLTALRGALTQARAAPMGGEGSNLEALEALVGFNGPALNEDGSPFAFSPNTDRAMRFIQERRSVRFHEPGDVVELPDVPDFQALVLGPPRGKDLRSSNPRRGEAYENHLAMGLMAAAAPDATPQPPPEGDDLREAWELSLPFDSSQQVTLEQARQDPWFRDHYFREADAWRSLAQSWLASASELALQLDGHINNTSLVLAFRHRDSGKVMLFPGDAQAGSWRSWHQLSFDLEDARTATELLGRTVLYKVGHHGSHNATLRELGLEKMTHPDLVALIPVDEQIAHRPKGGDRDGWDMPFPPLLEALQQRTKGRILRCDEDPPPADQPPAGAKPELWRTFRNRVETPESDEGTFPMAPGEEAPRALYHDLILPLT